MAPGVLPLLLGQKPRDQELCFLEKEKYYSHGTFTAPDALIGPMYLVFTEVFDISDDITKVIL